MDGKIIFPNPGISALFVPFCGPAVSNVWKNDFAKIPAFPIWRDGGLAVRKPVTGPVTLQTGKRVLKDIREGRDLPCPVPGNRHKRMNPAVPLSRRSARKKHGKNRGNGLPGSIQSQQVSWRGPKGLVQQNFMPPAITFLRWIMEFREGRRGEILIG
jgi:hypothetical protein